MIYTLRIDPEAQSEFDQAYDYYETCRSGLGDSFADAVEKVFERISTNPRIHQVVFNSARRAKVKGFPYCLYYREENQIVRIISIFHTSRDPRAWQKRV